MTLSSTQTIQRTIEFTSAFAQDGLGTRGRIVTPADADWDQAREAYQLNADQQPVVVVLASTVQDVQETVRVAAALGLRVAAQATGHNAGPLGNLEDTVLLRTGGLNHLSIDAERRRMRVGAGVRWDDVTRLAEQYGLAGLAGTSRTVGVVGYTLGGGLSWFGRAYGLAANYVTAIEVVTADGELRQVDQHNDPDLFWALRGGGGSFAVVTALEFSLLPLAQATAGALFWPAERTSDVLHTWRSLLPSLPKEVTTFAQILQLPPAPEIPEPLRGKSWVVVLVASVLSGDETASHLRDLVSLSPTINSLRPTSMTELADLHMDPPAPIPGVGDGMSIELVTAEFIDTVVRTFGVSSGSSLPLVELRHLDGELALGRTAAGALSGLSGQAAMFTAAITDDPQTIATVQRELAAVRAAFEPFRAATSYLNFSEQPRDASEFFDAATLDRLQRVKAAYDPADVIRSNHPVGRAM